VRDEVKNVELWAKNKGRAGGENKYDLPPPIDNDLYYGTMCVRVVDEDTTAAEDLTTTGWSKVYEGLFGGFETLGDGAEDDAEPDELDDIPDSMKTKAGYLKDGFVVDTNSDDEEGDVVVDDDAIMSTEEDSAEETEGEGVDAVVDGLSECSEEEYEYSDED
jgi:hypothetical protein